MPWEVFEAEEKPLLIPLRDEPFDTPTWAQCKVHPDHHVRFRQALCSVPTRWIGSQADVRGDRSLVRIDARGELIKPHERKPSDGRSTDYLDSRVPYARRWPNYYCQQAEGATGQSSKNDARWNARFDGRRALIVVLDE